MEQEKIGTRTIMEQTHTTRHKDRIHREEENIAGCTQKKTFLFRFAKEWTKILERT
jgi:hypothetical protein